MQKLKVLIQGPYGSPDKLCIAILSEGHVDIDHPDLKTSYIFGERIVLDTSLFDVKSFEKHFLGSLFVNKEGILELEHLNEVFILIGERKEYSDGESMGVEPQSTISCIEPWSHFISGGKGGEQLETAKDYYKVKGRKSIPEITIINGYRVRFTNKEIVKCEEVSPEYEFLFKDEFLKNLNKEKTYDEIELEKDINTILNSSIQNYDKISSDLAPWECFSGSYWNDEVARIILFEYKGNYSDEELKTILPCLDIGLSRAMIVTENNKRYIHIEAC